MGIVAERVAPGVLAVEGEQPGQLGGPARRRLLDTPDQAVIGGIGQRLEATVGVDVGQRRGAVGRLAGQPRGVETLPAGVACVVSRRRGAFEADD